MHARSRPRAVIRRDATKIGSPLSRADKYLVTIVPSYASAHFVQSYQSILRGDGAGHQRGAARRQTRRAHTLGARHYEPSF